MPINERKLKGGRIRYEARLNRRGEGWCRRFDTRPEAEAQLAQWKKLGTRKKYAGRIVNQHDYAVDIKGLWDFFTLGVKYDDKTGII